MWQSLDLLQPEVRTDNAQKSSRWRLWCIYAWLDRRSAKLFKRIVFFTGTTCPYSTPKPLLRIGESLNICPFLKNNWAESDYFSDMDRYKNFLRLKIHLIKKICYFDSHCRFYVAHRDTNVHRLHVLYSTVHSWEIMNSFIMAKYCRCILNLGLILFQLSMLHQHPSKSKCFIFGDSNIWRSMIQWRWLRKAFSKYYAAVMVGILNLLQNMMLASEHKAYRNPSFMMA